ncbi:MAG TPA: citrate/2-methylcitrate synthase, partial [Thermoanaerobaculia bacterium]|nr:citrate/2-methylcitrate synthase [Thermoanaerobaculia bacterium]
MSNPIIHNGLEGIVASETELSMVDGLAGELIIVGFPVGELAMNATFEETAFLLWYGRLPDARELAAFRADLASRRELPQAALDLLRAAADKQVDTMDALRMAAGTISLRGSSKNDDDAARDLLAAFPTIVASYWRLLRAHDP